MEDNMKLGRRDFARGLALTSLGAILPSGLFALPLAKPGDGMKLGLVTYQWGKDWDVPTLIKNCTTAKIAGVELRVEHAHNVSPEMSASQRQEVKSQFADSPVEIIGMGTNEDYDSPDPDILRKRIERTKEFIRLSKDIGGTGVKVKPNRFHEGVPQEKTLEQIGKSLNEIGQYAADLGQVIRLEVHGKGTQELPNIKSIMDVADNPAVGVCWNCNDQDLNGEGLEYNFNLVKDRFGDTVHVRELNVGDYPYQQLMGLFVKMDYKGWILLECRTNPEDRVAALKEQKKVFASMIKKGR